MVGALPSIISISILKTQSFLQGKSAFDPFFVDLFRSHPKINNWVSCDFFIITKIGFFCFKANCIIPRGACCFGKTTLNGPRRVS